MPPNETRGNQRAESTTMGQTVRQFGTSAVRLWRTISVPPRVYTTDKPRHATWLELFFDLVYVAAIAELGGLLHDDPSVSGFLGFAGLFFIVLYTWLGFTLYADQFDTDDLFHRLGMAATMLGVIILTATIHDALRGGSVAFTLAYLLLRVLMIGMYLRAWFSIPDMRLFTEAVILSTAASAVVWASSLLVSEPWRFVIWGLSYVVGLATTTVVYVGSDTIPKPTSHYSERLGLFTILVLGETVIAIAVETSGTDWGFNSGLVAGAGFIVVLALWWTYFRHVDEWFLHRAFNEDKGAWSRVREYSLVHVLSHYLVYVGIVAAGVGIAFTVEAAAAGQPIEWNRAAVLVAGVATYLLGTIVVHRTTFDPVRDRSVVLRLGVVALVTLSIVHPPIEPIAFLGFVASLLVTFNIVEGGWAVVAGPTRER
ncbi:low temperature requirement protein A [Haladaptatus sp. YSMS36]|uniref:low temperature requirement protein A n=1 Tax=Haladaptatus sp. YSMS36 TaxID=3033384 RepID=UPI0023E79D18|nr:low temperature requirement protein A [Haladaptatus sp. YSMS36]